MNKKNLQLGIVLVVLIVLAYLYQGPLTTWRENMGAPRNFLATFSLNEVASMNIDNGDKKTELINDGGAWKIGGSRDFLVDDQMMINFEGALDDAGKNELELVSDNPERQLDFGTDSDGALVSANMTDGSVKNFIVGNMSSDGASFFIREQDSDKTYKAQGNLAMLALSGAWEDKQIFSFAADSVDKIRFQYQKSNFMVEKRDDVWVGIIPYRFSVAKEKIQTIIDTMASLKAVAVPVQSFEGTGLEKNIAIVQMTGEGVDNTIMIGEANEEGQYYVKRGNSDNIYLISEETKNKFVQSINDLK